ncbi:ABC transporter substrate-binding protein [Nocardiopsis flavescens]|uniref:NitT/TauT family transport system substrate-binding protein n=1 Tax=Nocardiopsis flavescens TaxID=758803 RepID=A0A1M6V3G6_9ACTN|nr:ABC transporter substrate-binding protein [Nocardiopsis flavescens]SHK75944.1 NitT/TauT family transport system substrate-binding protein [Nocardiopsis flavescens]
MSVSYAFRKVLQGGAVLALALPLAACGGSDTGDGDTREVAMTLATPTWNAGIASIAVSQEMGYFEDEGLEVEVILADSATTQAQQIATGQVVTGAVSPEPVILGHQPDRNLDLTYFMSYYKDNIYGLRVPADSDITSIEDLQGKTVGAISLASASVTQAQVGLREAGVPEDSVTFVAIGTGGQQAAAVENGQVDALALLDTSFQVLENQGIELREIEVPGTDALTSGGLAARTSDLEADRELYVKLGRAIAKGVVFSQANPEAAIELLFAAHPEARPSGLEDDAAVASSVSVLEARLANLGAEDDPYGAIDPAALQANVDFLLDAGELTEEVDPDDLYDDSLISDINDFDREAVRQEAADHA